MKRSEQQLQGLLQEVEEQLRQMALWTDESPSQQALASQAPFCLDAMAFNQWLQWVFLPRIHALKQTANPLPYRCAIAPLAEVWLQQQGWLEAGRGLIAALKALDRLLSPDQH